MSKWQSMENAPEDNTILLDVGLPFPVVGCWSPVENSWLYANLGIDLYLGRWEDCYFESEFESKPHAWMPLPEMQKRNHER